MAYVRREDKLNEKLREEAEENAKKLIEKNREKEGVSYEKTIPDSVSAGLAFIIEFQKFKEAWEKDYPGAVNVWVKNWKHVEQLYDYTNAIRRIMYTTNTIESINSSFRKVTKKGVFPNDQAVLKVLYLRVLELYDKWIDRPTSNWAEVKNHLVIIDKFTERIEKYEKYEFPSLKL